MGKSYKRRGSDCELDDETTFVALDEIHVTDSTWHKLIARDHGQIEKMRQDFETGRSVVRVVLRRRAGGGYNVEDGRHRVIAAMLADVGGIEAIIVGG